ncbi:hypothetical protein [Natronorubrum sp. DTA7]|uniref:hypothetical protein n=1 Tax=Natronorubrum sp. DTA7 TaxID=3447016 RepID=UPI003F8646B6
MATEGIAVADERRSAGRETDETVGDRCADRECDLCGEIVPAAVYREHLLKSCPGR